MKHLCNARYFSVLLVAGANLLYSQTSPADPERRSQTIAKYLQLPLAFEKLETAGSQRFVARGQGYSIDLQDGRAFISASGGPGRATDSMSLSFAGGTPRNATLGSELPGKTNYMLGSDPRIWRLGVPTFDRITYRDVYPGIDVVYYGNQQQLEFDMVLRPGADPRAIRLRLGGAAKLALDDSGALRIGENGLRIGLPDIYQEVNGTRHGVKGRYLLVNKNEVAFHLDSWDRTKPLVIDPTILYSSIFGGSNTTEALGIALAPNGNAYIAGFTAATDLPLANAAIKGLRNGQDGFVAEMNADGTALVFSTYAGGAGTDNFESIAVDANGNAWIAGLTTSADFPVLNATQQNFGGVQDAVVAELNALGQPLFSTFLGGAASDSAFGIAVDSTGNAYVTGSTAGAFPTTAGAFQTANQGGNDVFVAKFSSGNAEVYATLLGGAGFDAAYSIAVDTNGNAYVTGQTNSDSFSGAPAGGAQSVRSGDFDAFVAKLNASGSSISYFTFLGGSSFDRASAIAVDSGGNAYLAGYTFSPDLATTGTLQIPYGGGADGFVAEVSPDGSSLKWLTYVGGNRSDFLFSLSLDGSGNVYVAGATNSPVLPVTSALQPALALNSVSLFRTTNSGSLWSAFDTNLPGAVSGISADPVTSGTIVAVTEQGIYLTTSGGASWTRKSASNPDSGSGTALVSRSAATASTLYAVLGTSLLQSTNNGSTWTAINSSLATNLTGVVADPLTAGTVYTFGNGLGVTRFTGNGSASAAVNTGLPNLSVQALTAGPDGTLYAIIAGNGAYQSTNQGGSWTAINTGLSPTFSGSLHGISASTSTPGTVYIAALGGIYKTTNSGTSWSKLSAYPGTGSSQVAVSPANSSIVYAVSGTAVVYMSPDAGTSWSLVENGLLASSVVEIAFDPTASATAFAIGQVGYAGLAAKLNPSSASPAWLTYFGGTNPNTLANGIAADGNGNAYLTGFRSGLAFPVTTSITTSPTGAATAFVTKISDATAACAYSAGFPFTVLTGSAQTVAGFVTAPSGCAWTAASDSAWAVVSIGASGAGAGGVAVQIAQNTTGATRTATLTVAGNTITITQADSSCTYVLSPSSFTLPTSGGSRSFTLTTGAGCPWALANNYGNAITVTSATSGTGSSTISFNVAQNNNLNGRTLSLPVQGSAVSINQGGNCTFSLNPTSATFSAAAGSASVNVIASNSGCTWAATSNLSGFSITNGFSGTGNGTVSYSFVANAGVPKSGRLTIAGLNFPVSQAGLGSVYLLSTIAGGLQPAPAAPATAMGLPGPNGILVDPAGNGYIVSQAASSVFRLSQDGVLTRIAGTGINGFSGDGGPAINAQLSNPFGIAFDGAGNLYIADSSNNRIRMIDTSGTISTIAGTGTFGFAGDGGPATLANLANPTAVAVDAGGNIYIADTNNQRIRKISGGTITTVAGNGTAGFSGDNGPGTSAMVSNPQALAVDASGNLYIADTSNNRVRKLASGNITTIAGTGVCCFSGDGGQAVNAQMNAPRGLAVDGAQNLYIADSNNNRIRIVALNGVITTVVGNGAFNSTGDGSAATSATLRTPEGITVDGADNLWIADYNNHRIRKVTNGVIQTVAGGGGPADPGPAPLAALTVPSSVAKDSSGNIVFADQFHNLIRKIAPNGTLSTIAGTGVPGFSGDNGPATSANINEPESLTFDAAGNLFFTDVNNFRVRKIDTGGTITTVAGNGTGGLSGDGGPATSAQIAYSQGIAFDVSGNLYIADTNNHRIRKISSGIITTVAGTTFGYSGDGGAATSAQLNGPDGIAFDSNGDLYIADAGNNRIRKVSGGIITTFAGNGNCCFAGDGGPATSAQFNAPRAVAFDSANSLYIAETNSNRIREVSGGVIATVAGNGGFGNAGDAGPAVSANMRNPLSLTVDSGGNIYIADSVNDSIRLLTPVNTTPVLTVTSTHTGNFDAGSSGSYSLTVANLTFAGSTSGAVTVSEIPPAGLSVSTMSGTGWTCGTTSCTRNDTLAGGAAYPPITVAVNLGSSVPLQVTNLAVVSGGGAAATGSNDLTLINPAAPTAPVPISPADGSTNVSILPTLSWTASPEAVSYDVYFGTSATPPLVGNTTGLSFTPASLNALLATSTTYNWKVVAKNGTGSAASPVVSFTTYGAGFCTYSLSPSTLSLAPSGGVKSVAMTAPAGCLWLASSDQSWLSIDSDINGSGNSTISLSAAANTGIARTARLSAGGQTVVITETADYLVTSLIALQQPLVAVSATANALTAPFGVASDAAGNTYISSQQLNAVFRLDGSGVLSRVAGTGVCGSAGDGGAAIAALLCSPSGLAVDTSGNLYIADSGNFKIRKIAAAGTISTVAGTGVCCYSGDGGAATSAQINFPEGIAVDAAGNIYIADTNNHRIRKVSGGIIATLAGTGVAGFSGDGGAATSAQLSGPQDVAVDSSGNVYIADRNNNRVRRVTIADGRISTFAGSNICCNVNDNGPATNAWLASPQGLAVDASGNVFIADTNNNRVREVATNGLIATVSGNGAYGFTGDGGAPTSAQFRSPVSIVLDPSGSLLIADTGNQRVRLVRSGTVATVAGAGDLQYPIPFTNLAIPQAVAVDGSGNVFIADTANSLVRKVTPAGVITNFAGTGVQGYSGDSGAATSAMINNPTALTLDGSGNLFILDADNNRVRKVDTNGTITTVAGNGTCCYSGDGGAATSAQINFSTALAIDNSGALYIADTNNNRIRKVSGGTITTIAGNGIAGFAGDGGPAASSQLRSPQGVAVDGAGNVYIADSGNNRIREVSGGNIATFAGNGTCCFSGDGGPASLAQINNPRGLLFDGQGNLQFADSGNQRIREITPDGTIFTIAGSGNFGFAGDAGPALSANFRNPQQIAVDAAGRIYIADTNSNSVRILSPAGTTPALTVTSSHTGSFNAGAAGSYTLTVSNGSLAAATNGTVNVIDTVLPAGAAPIASMAGIGWNCTGTTCTRTDALLPGASYPSITVTANVSGTAPLQMTNVAFTSTGGTAVAGALDFTLVTPNAPGVPVLVSPANAATNVSVLPTLTWTAASGATSYDVFFGTSPTPPLAGNTTGISFSPATLASPLTVNTTYFWQVVAKNNVGSTPSAVFSFTTYPNGFCTYSLNPAAAAYGINGGSGSVAITAPAGCVWTATTDQPWLSITSATSGSGNGTVTYSVAANSAGLRTATLTIGGKAFPITELGAYLVSAFVGGQFPPVAAQGSSLFMPPPTGITVDAAGNRYIAAQNANMIYKLDASGVLSRYAGTGTCGSSGDGGSAVSANLCQPASVAIDAGGNLYIADSGNHRIRKVTAGGTITTIAGTGTCCYSGDGGPATSAQFNFPEGVAVDGSGNVYIADTNNHRLRKIAGGIVTTVAGTGTAGFSGDGGLATGAQLSGPQAVLVDTPGNIYIADRNNNRVRKVTIADSKIATFAGNNVCCNPNDGGPATGAWLSGPQGLAFDSVGNIYIADTFNNRIRLVATNGVITTAAGTGAIGYNGDGLAAASTQLKSPQGVAVDSSDNLLIADTVSQRIRMVTGGTVSTIAGTATSGDGGTLPFATLSAPASVAADANGNIYVADSHGNRVRMITPAGVISTFAGTGTQGYSGDGGPATSATLNQPQALALDSSGNLYIYDSNNNRIREVSGGTITTIAGNGTCCYSGDGAAATSAQISYGWGLAVDSANNVYIADTGNQRVRKVSGGTITTIAGTGAFGYSGDNGAATSAQLANPNGVAVDAGGNVYIADSNNHRIRKVSGGTITTFAGTGVCCFNGDGGPATTAQLNFPRNVYTDNTGTVYILDSNNNRVREVTPSGTILTIAGNGGNGYTGDGGPALSANFRSPQSLAFDGSGNIYLADVNNEAIRRLTPVGTAPLLTVTSTHTGSFNAGAPGSYTVTVTNAASAAATGGTVSVTEMLPSGMTLGSISGTGWTCPNATCTRSDALAAGSSYPPLTVTANVGGSVPLQMTNEVVVSGGGSLASGGEDFTLIVPNTPAAPVLISPANAATNVSVLPTLTWTAASGATSYDVFFGTSPTPPLVGNTTGISFSPATLASPLTVNTTYFWQVVAKNNAGSTPSSVFSFTTYPNGFCTYILNPTSAAYGANGGSGSVSVTAPAGCVWTAGSSQPWLSITSAASGSGNGTVSYSVGPNGAAARTASLTIGGQTFGVTEIGSYLVSTIAGGQLAPVAATATAVTIAPPSAVVTDNSGNAFIAVPNQNIVYKLTTDGTLMRFAGTGVCGNSGDNAPAVSASLCSPTGLAFDNSGNLIIADSGNGRIRRVNAAGTISTIAGGVCCALGDGGNATSANLNFPQAVGFDSTGVMYIADTNNHRIRKVVSGTITTLAGNGVQGFSGDGGLATSASIGNVRALAVDAQQNVYIAESDNNRVRIVTASDGKIATFAGSNVCCNVNDNGAATAAWIAGPQGLALDASGNLLIADTFNNRIRRVVTSTGIISTVAGNGGYGFAGDGGLATNALLRSPQGIASDASGNLWLADAGSQRIRKVVSGNIATVAGGGGLGDGGPGVLAGLGGPFAIVRDSSGNIYFTDTFNDRVRRLSANGVISTVAGTGVSGFSGDNGPAVNAQLSDPQGLALDTDGNLYIMDSANGRVRKVDTAGNITTYASGLGFDFGIAVDSAKNVYIADANGHAIRKADSAGHVTVVAGNGTPGYSGDSGPATSAQLNFPTAVALDAGGNIYIADTNNNRIRIVSGGNINTIVGNGTCCFSGDGGNAASAQINRPRGIALDTTGTLYFADANNNRIREVTTSGTILTIAGNGNFNYQGDGGPSLSAAFRTPFSVVPDGLGNLYIADISNDAIRLLTPSGSSPVLTVSSTHTDNFLAGGAGTYTLTVNNTATAGSTSGTVTVTDMLPTGLGLNGITGTGWSCTGNSCTRADTLAGGASYPPLTVSVNVGTASQYTNQVTVSGGGAPTAGAEDTSLISLNAETISFAALPTQILSGPPFAISATSSSGLSVGFTSNTSAVCTVAAGVVTLVSAGTCSITATQPGDAFHSAAIPVTVTFTVNPAFADVSTGAGGNVSASMYAAISLMAAKGITSGCSTVPFDYCPGDTVTRGQMAVFIVRSIYGTNNFTYNPVPFFTDVPANAQFFKYIQKMKELGITSGCTTTAYCPNDTISRGQMAVFIVRARYGTGVTFNFTSAPYFTDVSGDPANPNFTPFYKYIQKMKDIGITSGCSATAYCPNDSVTRSQMAVFLMRGAYNQLLPGSTPIVSSVSPVSGSAGTTVNVTITGTNTSFTQGTTVVSAGTGITVQNVTVSSATSLTAQFVIGSGAAAGPVSVVVSTGTEEAVAPNAFTITTAPAAGAIANWRGNGTTTNAVSGLNGTLTNGATYASATSRTLGVQDAQAFSLNGINSYVQASAVETAAVSGARTLTAWVNPGVITGLGQPILTGGLTGGTSDIFGISGATGSCAGSGPYHLYIDHNAGTCYVSNLSLAPNTWSLVTVTFDGASAVFYVNAVPSVSASAQMSGYGLSSFAIGGNTLGGTSTSASFNGLLSEVQVYSRALTPAEVLGLYQP
jgi:hypothetical protein